MIALLKGTVTAKHKTSIVLMTSGGVGYEVYMQPLKVLSAVIGNEMTLYTYLKVSDSALDLYGFEHAEDKDFFSLLMTVSGVGPKTAMNILSLGSMKDIGSAIGRGDVKYLTAVSGLGKKTAERLVVELKTKIGSQGGSSSVQGDSGVLGDVIEALIGLGYSAEDAKSVVTSLDAEGKNTEEVLRMALRKMK